MLVLGAVLASLAAPASALASPAAPVETAFASNSTTLSGALQVATSGHTAWVATYIGGQLTAVDFSNPASPTVFGSTAVPSPFDPLKNATNLTLSGNYAYVVSKNHNAGTSNDDGTGNSLTVVDISDPASPNIVGWVHDAVNLFGGYGVAVQGNYAYVAAQGCVSGQPCPDPTVGNSFAVVDVSNPASPTIVATLHNDALPAPFTGTNALDHATSVAVSGNYAYVTAAYSNRLTVIDISDPLNPTIVASLRDNTALGFDVDVTVQGSYAYVANQGGNSSTGIPGLAVVDISNPAAPTVVGTDVSAWLNGAYRVRAQGNMAYVAGNAAESAVAVDVSNPAAPRTAAGLYDPTNFSSADGVAVDAAGQHMFVTSPSKPSDPSGTYTGTLSIITLDPKPVGVTVSSTPPATTGSTSATFAFSSADSVSSLACQLDGAAASPCATATSQSYSGLSPGSHTFQVTATDAAGNTASSTPFTWTVTAPPADAASPTVSGTANEGQSLSADPGTWSGYPTPTYTYQWQDCDSSGASCAAIPGATSSSYGLTASDVGSTIEVIVTATNGSGQSSATSAPTATVTGTLANTTRPTISGTAALGQTLTAGPGTWSPSAGTTYAYQWSDCAAGGASCSQIGGATASTYVLASSDVGSTIVVTVTASNPSAGAASANSLASAAVSAPPANTSHPGITGTATQGQKLTASPGTWTGTPSPTYAYQWEVCDSNGANCTAISGANAAVYTATGADVGRTLVAAVTATNSAGQASATSQATGIVTGTPAPPPSPPPPSPPPPSPPPPSLPPPVNHGTSVTSAQLLAWLRGALAPAGPQSKLSALRKHNGYTLSFKALESGVLEIRWYYLPRNTSLATSNGHIAAKHARGVAQRPVLVAEGRLVVGSAGKHELLIKLTRAGRGLLRASKAIQLTAAGTFAADGQTPVAAVQHFKLFLSRSRVLG